MKKLLPLLMLLLLLTGCSAGTDTATEPAVRETPNSDRTDFEIVGTLTQAEDRFLILELCLYEASGEPLGDVATLAQIDADSLIPGYETRAVLLDKGAAVYYLYDGEVFPCSAAYLAAGQRVGISAAGNTMSILIYDAG